VNNRIKFLSTASSLFFLILLSRFFYFQIIKGQEIKEKSILQSYKLIKELPDRGTIYTNDNFPIVTNKQENKIAIYRPELKQDINEIYGKLSLLNNNFFEENKKLIDLFNNPLQKWVEFSTNFTNQQIDQIKNTPGVQIISNQKRYYPEGSDFAINVLGKLGKNNQGSDSAYGGIEAYYNKQLIGKPGYSWASRDAMGKIIITQKGWGQEKKDGFDVHTNINRQVQFLAEKYLRDGINKYSADSGSITIMEPKTGKIIAITSQEATCNMTEIVSATKIPPIINKTNSCLTITAITPIAAPSPSAPTSPIKICAGCELYHKKPKRAPISVADRITNSALPAYGIKR
jgi:cell division protein FtsI/penicillin-binding protein 2